ncbi:MAG: hypothetical protein ABI566_09390 [Pseudolysinimonas sp.]
MHYPRPTLCPAWCVADHSVDDEGGRRRHRGATVTVAGIAIRGGPPHDVRAVELLIELHANDADPLVAIYIGDGEEGLDLTTETASRLVRRLIETLQTAGAAAV